MTGGAGEKSPNLCFPPQVVAPAGVGGTGELLLEGVGMEKAPRLESEKLTVCTMGLGTGDGDLGAVEEGS